MWIVKNNLRATLTLRGLDVSIGEGEEFDLDTLGRDRAEGNDQVAVAFEEHYLANVYKSPASVESKDDPAITNIAASTSVGVTAEEFDTRLEGFKDDVLSELRKHLPTLASESDSQTQLEAVRAAISADMKELLGELKLVRDRFTAVRGRIQEDPSLSDAEVRARLAFLEEQERELLKNFETVGRQIEAEDGDVMDKADLLANL